jgi:FixJ family two-component response regulator
MQKVGCKPKYDFRARFYHPHVWVVLRRKIASLSVIPVISVVDDDASVRNATQNLVRSMGYTVRTFASADAFLQSGYLKDTSCVIADVQMPGMNGVELQSLLRAKGCHIPFIFISAFPEATIRQRALRDGAICFLAKPFDGGVLLDYLNKAIEQYRAKR